MYVKEITYPLKSCLLNHPKNGPTITKVDLPGMSGVGFFLELTMSELVHIREYENKL